VFRTGQVGASTPRTRGLVGGHSTVPTDMSACLPPARGTRLSATEGTTYLHPTAPHLYQCCARGGWHKSSERTTCLPLGSCAPSYNLDTPAVDAHAILAA